MNAPLTIASSDEIGSLGVHHLKRLWSSALAVRESGKAQRGSEWHLDRMVIDGLGLSLPQVTGYLYTQTPTFSGFEEWIVATAGKPDKDYVDRLNGAISGKAYPESIRQWLDSIERSDPVLTPEDLSFWAENGYVVLKDAVDPKARIAAEKAIWERVGANPDLEESWYQLAQPGIMVEFIQHPALKANRWAHRIHKAFSQLWGTADLWVSTDRCGFHAPQRPNHAFPGPDLHWDIDFDKPVAFGTQGILYLTDTPAEQGALTVVPGFQHRLSDWLQMLEPGRDPQREDLHALGSMPISGQAGDMVIWHQSLPHGSRPNLGVRPRIVQYINMYPGRDYSRITRDLGEGEFPEVPLSEN